MKSAVTGLIVLSNRSRNSRFILALESGDYFMVKDYSYVTTFSLMFSKGEINIVYNYKDNNFYNDGEKYLSIDFKEYKKMSEKELVKYLHLLI